MTSTQHWTGPGAVSAAGYRLLFERAVEPLLLSDSASRTLDANARACELFGYSRAEMASLDRPLIVDVTDERLGPLMIERAARGWVEGNLRMIRRGGEPFEARIWSALILEEDGEPRAWMGVRDLTPEIAARAALTQANAILEAQFDGSPDGILVIDSQQRAVRANRLFREFTGFAPEWMQWEPDRRRMALRELVARPEDLDEFMIAWLSHPEEALDRKLRMASGQVIELRVQPLQLGDSGEFGHIFLYSDVTAREAMAARLRENEELQRTVITSLAEGVVLFRADGTIGASNDTAWEVLGRKAQRSASGDWGQTRSWLVGEDGRPLPGEQNPIGISFRTGEPCDNVLVGAHRPDGSLRWLLVNTRPVGRPEEAPWGVVASFLDVTERRAMEASLAQARHLESMAELAGGLAHKLNNQLTAIIGNSWIAGMAEGVPEDIRKALDEIATAATDAGELVQDLLRFSSAQVRRDQTVHLNDCAWAALGALAPEKQARTEIHPGADLPMVRGDMEALRVAARNLMDNALDADPGKVRVATGVARREAPLAGAIYAPAPPKRGCWLYLEVTDHGEGIAAENVSRVFDPFYTTRFTGRGLGLPGAAAVARDHGGCIELVSAPGEGTTARLLLPLNLNPDDDCALSEGAEALPDSQP